ncbi:MAG: hypothetical protein ABJB47_13795 [Actinomycetota bacterium]
MPWTICRHPAPDEEYAARFDDLFGRLAQRRGFREYLAGLLAPRDRNKTLTALAGAEPVAGAQHAAVQWLQFLLVGVAVGSGAGECPAAGAPAHGPVGRAARRWGAGDR